jgi:ATP-dependent Lhr-like helicase
MRREAWNRAGEASRRSFLLGFELCQRMRRILCEDTKYPYASPAVAAALRSRREDLGTLLRERRDAIVDDGSSIRWWTFAGGGISPTFEYAIERLGGFKDSADERFLRVEGCEGSSVFGQDLERLRSREFWRDPEARRDVVARVPQYRLSKFQDALPAVRAPEMIAAYLLDLDGAGEWVRGG